MQNCEVCGKCLLVHIFGNDVHVGKFIASSIMLVSKIFIVRYKKLNFIVRSQKSINNI